MVSFRHLTLAALLQAASVWGAEESYERPPISYSSAKPNDAISALQANLASGKVRLEGDERQVIRHLLKVLGIPEASQMLVFSKTSFQKDRIDPAHPRAIYFSDEVYVGWCPGGLAEIAALDPLLGPVFYRFDPHLTNKPSSFERDSDCLRCHGGTFVRDIPGLLARSVYTDAGGQPYLGLGSELVDGTTPIEQRWGGWYVTGLHGSARHRGNLVLPTEREPTAADLARGANLTSLSSLFDTGPYLVDSSDLVALLVFEHQVGVQNALTKANQHCLNMLAYQQGVQRDLKESITDEPAYDSVKHAFADSAQEVVDALLFKGEAALPPDGVRGSGAFVKAFNRGAKPAPGGHSLKELDLKRHLFKYRCSYLIQTTAFDRMQPVLRRWVLQRLYHVLADSTPDPRYSYLEPDERLEIRHILKTAVPSLPLCWTTVD